jgi:hypothetical protein
LTQKYNSAIDSKYKALIEQNSQMEALEQLKLKHGIAGEEKSKNSGIAKHKLKEKEIEKEVGIKQYSEKVIIKDIPLTEVEKIENKLSDNTKINSIEARTSTEDEEFLSNLKSLNINENETDIKKIRNNIFGGSEDFKNKKSSKNTENTEKQNSRPSKKSNKKG